MNNEYAKLVKSLYSGLPNEVDFAFNILTIMSSPGPHVLVIERCPSLLKLMIAHAGVYGDDEEIRSLAEEGWKQFCDRKFDEFWASAGISDEQICDYIPIKLKQITEFEKRMFTDDMEFDPTQSTCFRVLQTTGILRNLSFENFNVPTMGKSDILVKFLCVCVASKHVWLVNDALDTLSNIGGEIDLVTADGTYTNVMLLKVISDCLHSDDKNKTLHALEIIAALCQNGRNENVCAEFMGPEMLNRIFELATVRDILICIHTLETLYQFSELGRASCNRIIAVPNAIEQLVSLLTTDAASFGRTGLSGIQVIESYGHQQTSRQHYPPPPQSQQRPTYSTTQPSTSYHHPSLPSQHHHHQQLPPATPRPTTVVQKVLHPPQQPIQNHDDKLKALTIKWIKENIVAEAGSMAVRGEIYAACVDHLRSVNGIMSGTVQFFTAQLQSIFPNTTVISEQKDNKLNYYVDGIRYLKQGAITSNHPLMQKILATPKPPLPQVRIVPIPITSQTNGNITAPKPTIVKPPTPSIQNGDSKTSNISVPPVKQSPKIEATENGETSATLETCSEPVEAAKILTNGEPEEASIIRVENSKDKIEEVEPKKVINGHVVKNGTPSEEKLTNGVCNGVLSPENTKENGTNHNDHEDGEPMDAEIVSDIEENDDEMPKNNPAKIDETVKAVSKTPISKNGVIKQGDDEEANGETIEPNSPEMNGTRNRKRKQPFTPKTKTPKKAKTETTPKSKKTSIPAASQASSDAIPSTSTALPADLMCEWNACGQMFSTAEAVSSHIINSHLTDAAKYEDNTFICMWPGCNKTRRAKWSLVTHFQDTHCQEHLLRQSIIKRNEMGGAAVYLAAIRQQFADRASEPETIPTYTHAAAMDAIKRHSAVCYQREVTDEHEGPVTKCIRLTTALILRNIARYSEEGRCKLRRFELQLCPLALSRLEASGALIQCLAELDDTPLEDTTASRPNLFQPPPQISSLLLSRKQ